MSSFLDIMQMSEFREYIQKRLISASKNYSYNFSNSFPMLFRYRALSNYTIDDIFNEQITITSIGEFNDLFDGAIHRYGSDTEQKNAAEKKWIEMEELFMKTGMSQDILYTIDKENYTSMFKEHFKKDSRLKFGLLDYLGIYVCCFSANSDSTLMWSHYANSNKGICIAYNFNQWKSNIIQRNWLFPVTYLDNPIDVSDLLDDEKRYLCEYPLEAAVLCAALCKASAWKYEEEWRLIWSVASKLDNVQRLPLKVSIKPSAIYLGSHFLKECFYYGSKSNEYKNCENNIKNIDKLFNYMVDNRIPAYVMKADIGSYRLKPILIEVQKLQCFVNEHFRDFMPQSMRYYTIIHGYLMDLII